MAHTNAWGVALIMIAFASWLFYRFFAPRSWREWANAGRVQAFIIALYAEMYGFPLTIDLLARFFELDRGELNANLWSTALGMGGTAMMASMLLGYALVLFGACLLFKGWKQVHRTQQLIGCDPLPDKPSAVQTHVEHLGHGFYRHQAACGVMLLEIAGDELGQFLAVLRRRVDFKP